MDSNLYFSLKQIASWTSENSEVTIPALQRGLVWKPNQVELLWDSILRGFPISSFLLSDIVDKEKNGKYYLMDGQQRYNAISIGFNTVPNPRAVLWIDLEPPTVKNSTRIYWIKATTIPHPWGFKNDDDSSRLNTAEKRIALKTFNLQGNIYNREFSLSTTWPVEAKCPIPLSCLLESSYICNDAESFYQKARELFQSTDFVYRNKISWDTKAIQYVKNVLYPAFSALKEYRVNCNHLPKNVMESETLADAGEQTTLEVLFTRLNTGGTTISRDDLNYSAIKAYWPSIKEKNDSLAEKYMSPAKLVMLAFRLALTDLEADSLKNELSIRQIRSLAKKEVERQKIECLYQCQYLESILKRIDEWLGVSDDGAFRTPAFLRTIIARNSPDVYLLLMFFAYEDIKKPIELTSSQIKALAFSLHWFTAYNDKKGCVQEIFRRCKEGINLINIQKGIARLMHDCKLLHIYKSSEVDNFITIIDKNPSWRVWNIVPAPAREFFNRIFWNSNAESREMLLYAERLYINTHFSNYDPARQDMWAEYNRPWDFDHIVARNRIDRKQGDYREYDKVWLDCIGNFAAISYESNRSKNDGEDYSEYHDNIEALDYNIDIEKLPYHITYHPEASIQFAQITYNRFCKLYSKIYEIISVLFEQTILSKTLQFRKDLFHNIKAIFPDGLFHFAASDGNDHILNREQDWAREWLGIGIVKGDFMVCFEWPAIINKEGIPQNVEIGIRKAIGTKVTKENMKELLGKDIPEDSLNPWWYIQENCNTIDINYIKERINYYLQYTPQEKK